MPLIVPFSIPNAPVSPFNPSPMNYLIVVLFCHGRCHHHPSCSRILTIVMHSSSLIPRVCSSITVAMLPIFLTFGNLISGFISLVSNSLILTSYQQQQQVSIFLKGIGHFDQTNIPLERICYECSGITQRSQTGLSHSRSGLAGGEILPLMSN